MTDFDYSDLPFEVNLKDVPIPGMNGRGSGHYVKIARSMELKECRRFETYIEAQNLANALRSLKKQPLIRTIGGTVFVWRIE